MKLPATVVAYKRLYTTVAGFLFAGVALVVLTGFIPCLQVARADHSTVRQGYECTDYMASHNFANTAEMLQDPTYIQMCSFRENQWQEMETFLKAASSCPEGFECGFVTPVPGKSVIREAAKSPKLIEGLSRAGGGSPTASIWATMRGHVQTGTGNVIRGLRSFVEGDLAAAGAGGPATAYGYSSTGGVMVTSMVTSYTISGMSSGKQVTVSWKTSGSTAHYPGYFQVRCAGGTQVVNSLNLVFSATQQTIPVGISAAQVDCQPGVGDTNSRGAITNWRSIGPTISPDPQPTQTNTPNNYPLRSFSEPGEIPEVEIPEGDTVISPEETKRLYEQIRSLPEYDPGQTEEPDPGETEDDHIKRVRDLEPEHGPAEWTTENPDGSQTTRFRDGTQFTSWPNGREIIRFPDGSTQERFPDGTERRYDPNTGEEFVEYPDGTTRQTRYPRNTPFENLPGAQPVETPTWTEATGQPIPPPSQETYPEPPAQQIPPTGSTTQGSDTCSSPRPFKFDLPDLNLANIFPFSLVLRAWGWLSELVATPERPSFNLPFYGLLEVSDGWDYVIQTCRSILSIVFGVGLSLWFYRYISGRGSDA